MPTSFECNISVSAHPVSGKLGIAIGPVDMKHLGELLAYLGTDEAREAILDSATRAFMGDDSDAPQPTLDRSGLVHLRGRDRSACGLPIWTMVDGQRRTTCASVGRHDPTSLTPVTCPNCLAWIAEHQR